MTHNLHGVAVLPHLFDIEDEMAQVLDPDPNEFDTWFAIALAGEETVQLRDQAD